MVWEYGKIKKKTKNKCKIKNCKKKEKNLWMILSTFNVDIVCLKHMITYTIIY